MSHSGPERALVWAGDQQVSQGSHQLVTAVTGPYPGAQPRRGGGGDGNHTKPWWAPSGHQGKKEEKGIPETGGCRWKAMCREERDWREGGRSVGSESSPKASPNARLQTDMRSGLGGTIDAYWRNLDLSLKVKVVVAQSCPSLSDPLDLPGSSVHEIHQARLLEWAAIPFSRGYCWPRDQTPVSALQADSLLSEPPGKPPNLSLEVSDKLKWYYRNDTNMDNKVADIDWDLLQAVL